MAPAPRSGLFVNIMFCLAILGMFILDDIVGNDEDDLFGDLSFRLGVVWIYAMFLESGAPNFWLCTED